jgi:hypothetical protein
MQFDDQPLTATSIPDSSAGHACCFGQKSNDEMSLNSGDAFLDRDRFTHNFLAPNLQKPAKWRRH